MSNMSKKLQEKPLSNPELAEFSNQMGILIKSGISASEGLHLLFDDAQSKDERAILSKMIEVIEATGVFYEAALSAGVFPDYMLSMIKLGEETGTLDATFYKLSAHYTREEYFNHMLRSSLLYPSIMLGMMVLIIITLLTKVMPIFQQVFEQLGTEMSGFSAGLLNIGNILSKYSIAFTILAVIFIMLIALGRKHIPFYKDLQEKIATCRFADGMSTVLKSGLSPEKGLDLVSSLIDNNLFCQKIDTCRYILLDGMDFNKALRESCIFTGSYSKIVAIASKTGNMDEAMAKIASEYEYSINQKINNLISMLEPTLVIVLSFIVGIILFSVMLPLLGIMSGL